MASEGPNYPSTVVNDTSYPSGTKNWLNPSNATTSNNLYAEAEGLESEESYYLKATNFGFTIPAGATIDGIIVEVEKQDDGPGETETSVMRLVKDGTVDGTDRSGDDPGTWSGSDSIATFGDSTTLWNLSWDATDINASDFGCVIVAEEVDFETDAKVDFFRITVHYTEASSSTYDETGDGGAEVAGEAEVRPFIETASGGATSGGIALRGCHAPLEDLVFSYPFDEGSGTIVHDETPNANDGTMVGPPAWVAGGGLDFSSDYINMGSGVLDFTGDFSIACKVNTNTLNFRRIIQNRGTGAYGTQAGWLLRITSSGAIEFGLENTDNDYNGTTSNPFFLSTGTDYYIGATFNSATGQKKVYVDGQEVLDVTDANLIGSDFSSGRTSTIGVALEPSATQYWDGEIFNICVWDTLIGQSVFMALAGLNLYEETGTGGAVAAGEASLGGLEYDVDGTGGVVCGGTNPFFKKFDEIAVTTPEVRVAGESTVDGIFSVAADGGVVCSGLNVLALVEEGSGGASVGGNSFDVLIQCEFGDGGVWVSGGDLLDILGTRGGVVCSGEADVSGAIYNIQVFNPAPGGVTINTFQFELEGAQVVPPVTTNASAKAVFSLDEEGILSWEIYDFNNFATDIVSIQIHGGFAGETGPFQFELSDYSTDITEDPVVGAKSINEIQQIAVTNDFGYITITTEANDPEIRGQIILSGTNGVESFIYHPIGQYDPIPDSTGSGGAEVGGTATNELNGAFAYDIVSEGGAIVGGAITIPIHTEGFGGCECGGTAFTELNGAFAYDEVGKKGVTVGGLVREIQIAAKRPGGIVVEADHTLLKLVLHEITGGVTIGGSANEFVEVLTGLGSNLTTCCTEAPATNVWNSDLSEGGAEAGGSAISELNGELAYDEVGQGGGTLSGSNENVVITPATGEGGASAGGTSAVYKLVTEPESGGAEIAGESSLTAIATYNIAENCHFDLSGDQVVPSVSDSRAASAIISIDSKNVIRWEINYSGKESNVTNIQFRGPANVGETGPVIFETSNVVGALTSGTTNPNTGAYVLTDLEVSYFKNGTAYLTIVTDSAIETRGQIVLNTQGAVSTGGSETIFSIVPTGGVVASGEAFDNFINVAKGGAEVGGEATKLGLVLPPVSGGGVIGGDHEEEFVYNPTTSGGATVSGKAVVVIWEIASGGAEVGGTGPEQKLIFVNNSGGAVVSGEAIRIDFYLADLIEGGIKANGRASVNRVTTLIELPESIGRLLRGDNVAKELEDDLVDLPEEARSVSDGPTPESDEVTDQEEYCDTVVRCEEGALPEVVSNRQYPNIPKPEVAVRDR